MKTLYILRGLPGSGKSTLAKALSFNDHVVCSTDDYFMKDGVYRFDHKDLQAAHTYCMEKAFKACSAEHNDFRTVIIDNTHTCYWEFDYYVNLAEQKGYTLVVLTVSPPRLQNGTVDCVALAERNVHGVPLAAIERMAARWEP